LSIERFAVTTNAQKHFTAFPEGQVPLFPCLRATSALTEHIRATAKNLLSRTYDVVNNTRRRCAVSVILAALSSC